MEVLFPDGQSHALTTMRTAHALHKTANIWSAPDVSARYEGADGFRIEIGGAVHFLRHVPPVYVGGGWPAAVPTAYVLRRLEDERLMLEVWSVEYKGHGPDHLVGFDTP